MILVDKSIEYLQEKISLNLMKNRGQSGEMLTNFTISLTPKCRSFFQLLF